jgi:hypothetical protein
MNVDVTSHVVVYVWNNNSWTSTSYEPDGTLISGDLYLGTDTGWSNPGLIYFYLPAAPPISTPALTVSAPSNLAATPGTGAWIELQWQDVSNAESAYEVERQDVDTGADEYFMLPADTSEFVDPTVVGGTRYKYIVGAVSGSTIYWAVWTGTLTAPY